jgi:homoserine dehydrogenase
LERVDIDLLIETTITDIRDGEPGLSNITSALSKGIDVITTNKGPVALSFYQLKKIAERSGSRLRYSGTVGGGTPILDFARQQLKNEKILSVKGVLNSTSNYILWKMAKDKVNLKDALQEAKNRKIAERDSRYDITGIDTACKLVILANSIMDFKVDLKDVTIEGIENVSLNNVLEAENAGKAVRLIGRIEDRLRVSPELIAKTDPLCVEADNNSICFSTEYNNYILIGKGAGGKETANTVIRDLLDLYQVELLQNKTVSGVALPLVS